MMNKNQVLAKIIQGGIYGIITIVTATIGYQLIDQENSNYVNFDKVVVEQVQNDGSVQRTVQDVNDVMRMMGFQTQISFDSVGGAFFGNSRYIERTNDIKQIQVEQIMKRFENEMGGRIKFSFLEENNGKEKAIFVMLSLGFMTGVLMLFVHLAFHREIEEKIKRMILKSQVFYEQVGVSFDEFTKIFGFTAQEKEQLKNKKQRQRITNREELILEFQNQVKRTSK